MGWTEAQWAKSTRELAGYLQPLAAGLGRSERRIAFGRYVTGLLIPGQRKSITPIAERLEVDSQGLQQFLTDSPWEEEALWRALRQEVAGCLGGLEHWIIDETGWIKQGRESVGVQHQYCGAVGKQANCQIGVHLMLSDGWMCIPVAGRLYLPESWCSDLARRRRAKVPAEVDFATKPQIALQMVADAVLEGVPRAPILADAVYGHNEEFRSGLRKLGLEYALQANAGQATAWTEAPQARSGPASVLAELCQDCSLRPCRWRSAGGQLRRTRLGWKKIWLAADRPAAGQPWPWHWLVVDWPENRPEPQKLYLVHLLRPLTKNLALLLCRSRWQIEQSFSRAKDDLGLDHLEARSWRAFHHHLALCAAAYFFVAWMTTRSKKNFQCDLGTGFTPDPTLSAEISRLLSVLSN
jgi:SRSO17 transposase